MNLDWSEQSPHIRSLFRLWQSGDGYDEEAIAAGEARLGVRLPAVLRRFYATWGKRDDLTEMNGYLLAPDKWVARSGALIICVENQAFTYWALPLSSEDLTDSPVLWAEAAPDLEWCVSHPHTSAFLDDLTYLHAFSGGALHGAESGFVCPQPQQIGWLDQEWRTATLTPMFEFRDPAPIAWWGSPVYVRDGQAVYWLGSQFFAVAASTAALDEIARELGVVWEKRW